MRRGQRRSIGGGGWGTSGVTVSRRCQPSREAKILGNERRGEEEGSRERSIVGGAKQSAKKFRFGSIEV